MLLNIAAIAAGSLAGNLLKRSIPRDAVEGVMAGIGVVLVFIGATGVSKDTSAIALLIACALGCFIGYALDLEGKLDRASKKLEARFGTGNNRIIGPGMSFFIVSCSGAYTVNACFFAGMGEFSMLFVKIALDLIVSLTMSAALGIGVMFAVVPLTLYQGTLILLSGVLSPLLTPVMIDALATTGSIIAALVGTNMIGATKIRIINFLPAVVLAPFAAALAARLPI